jgi:hypothetical protein
MTWPVRAEATQKVAGKKPRNVPIRSVDVGCRDGRWCMQVIFDEDAHCEAGTVVEITHYLGG